MRVNNALFLSAELRTGKSERTGNDYSIPLVQVFDFDANQVFEVNINLPDGQEFEPTSYGTPQESRVDVLVTSCEVRSGRLSMRGDVAPARSKPITR